MVGLGLAAVVVWALMMFGPGTTAIHHGSYATMVLLWVGLAGVVGSGSARWAAALAAVQVAWFVVVWARDLPGPAGPIGAGDAAVAVAAGALLLGMLRRVAAGEGASPERRPRSRGGANRARDGDRPAPAPAVG